MAANILRNLSRAGQECGIMPVLCRIRQSERDQQIAIGRVVLVIDNPILISCRSAGCRLPSPGEEMIGPLSKVALRPFPDTLNGISILIQLRQDQTISLPFGVGNPVINVVYYSAIFRQELPLIVSPEVRLRPRRHR